MRKLIACLAVAIAVSAAAQTVKRKGPIIRQVDRVLIESTDPKALFAFLRSELQLPEAWPITEHQAYASGGLGAGNVIIEIYQHAPQGKATARRPASAHFAGMALEPYPLADALRELKAGKVPHGPPQPALSKLPDGTTGVAWTTVPLTALSKPDMSIFLHEYSQAFLKADVRRKQLGNRLTLNNGGPFGIQSVQTTAIEAAGFDRAAAEWRRLLGPQSKSGEWIVGAGPSIRLVQGTRDHLQKIVFRVQSLNKAKTHMTSRQLAGTIATGEISIKPSKVQGLDLAFAE